MAKRTSTAAAEQNTVKTSDIVSAIKMYCKKQILAGNTREARRSDDYPDPGFNLPISDKIENIIHSNDDVKAGVVGMVVEKDGKYHRCVYAGTKGDKGQPATLLFRKTAYADDEFDQIFDKVLAGEEISGSDFGLRKTQVNDDLPF